MSDIIERAARVLHEHYSRTDGLDVTAQESAQALADAKLLRGALTDDIWDEAVRRYPLNHVVDDPHGATGAAESDPYGYDETARAAFVQGALWGRAHTTQGRVATDVQGLEAAAPGAIIRDAPGNVYERLSDFEETDEGVFGVWLGTYSDRVPSSEIKLPAALVFEPGQPTEPTRLVPTREQIAQAIRTAIDDPRQATWSMDLDAADAVLELFAQVKENPND